MSDELPFHQRRVFVEWRQDGKQVEWRRLRKRLELQARMKAKEAAIVERGRPVVCPVHGEPDPYLLVVEGERDRLVRRISISPGDACCARFVSKVNVALSAPPSLYDA